MTDVVGNPEEERRADFYFQPWAQEAVCRYFYSKVQNSMHSVRSLCAGTSRNARPRTFPITLLKMGGNLVKHGKIEMMLLLALL